MANKYVRLRGRPYIHTCRSYVHMSRELTRHAITVRLPTLNFTSGWLADSYDFGLLGEQSSPKWEISCPERPWTTVQNLTPLALSSPEKSITVQTKKTKNKQTVNDISTPYPSACLDKKTLNKAHTWLNKVTDWLHPATSTCSSRTGKQQLYNYKSCHHSSRNILCI